jgi:hypothetical protein
MYDIVSFIDDDNWIEKQWVQKVYSIFNQYRSVGACAGKNIPVCESEPPAWFPFFEHSYAAGKLHFNEGIVGRQTFGNLWGAGLSIRKEIFNQLDAINFTFITSDRKGKSLSSGGDTELCYAVRLLGYDLYYTNDLILKHFIPSFRLQWAYVQGLNYEFGKLYTKTQPYYSLYHQYPQKPWLKYVKSSIYLYIRHQLASIIKADQKSKWTHQIKAIWWRGRLMQLLEERPSKNKEVYIYLKQMFQHVATKKIHQEA